MRTRTPHQPAVPDHNRALVAGLLLAAFLALGSASPAGLARAAGTSGPASPAGALRVAASIFPLGDIARAIGGSAVTVDVLVPAGATPHGFEPTPAQAEMLARTDLLLTVGLGIDPWAQASASAGGKPGLTQLVFAETIDPETLPAGVGADPHVWLDPVLTRRFAAVLTARLQALRPAEADSIGRRGARYDAQLAALDAEYRDRLARVTHRKFVAQHAAFAYIAARYGLEQASIFDAQMHEPGPEAMEAVIRLVRDQGVRAIFMEPQMPPASIAWLKEQVKVPIGRLDPEGNPALAGYDSYLGLMRSNLDELVRGLGQ
jgi:zinc transport system substrate-binding protein